MADDEEAEASPRRFDELAREIADHDREAVDADPGDLHFQWNVPEGRTPHIPLWLSLLFFGSLAAAVIVAVLGR